MVVSFSNRSRSSGLETSILIEKQLPKLAEQDGTTVEEALNHHTLGKQWIKRLLEPSEIGATAVFLASDGAAAITGEEIGVAGGI